MRLHLTDQLRTNVAGVMRPGVSHSNIYLAPGYEHLHMSGTDIVPEDASHSGIVCHLSPPVTIFASMAHMHERGRQAWTDIVRKSDGRTETLAEDPHFHFDHQHYL